MWPGATEGRNTEPWVSSSPWAYVRRLLPLCFTLVIIQTDTQLGYKVPVCSAGVRGFAVFFILDFFFTRPKKTGTWRARGLGK